ncbi:MAG: hypothetical protein WBA74_02865 [Cyclobacteriaceae bacterium]
MMSKSYVHQSTLEKIIKVGGILTMLILPKCSLCLFAVTGAITVCGIKADVPALWEYVAVFALSVGMVVICLIRLRGKYNYLFKGMLLTGLLSVAIFLISGTPVIVYYAGIGLISFVSIVTFGREFREGRCCAEILNK